jgi:hypothetical protein
MTEAALGTPQSIPASPGNVLHDVAPQQGQGERLARASPHGGASAVRLANLREYLRERRRCQPPVPGPQRGAPRASDYGPLGRAQGSPSM